VFADSGRESLSQDNPAQATVMGRSLRLYRSHEELRIMGEKFMKKSVLQGIIAALFLFFTICVYGQTPVESPVPSSEKIRQILVDRLGPSPNHVGIVVGVIDPAGRRVIAVGSAGENRGAVDGNTVFEIGSITKVFTSLLLADMVERGEVALDDPVAKYLPPDVKMPERNGRAITLEDLARHRSALPPLPTNLNEGADPQNPYAHYSVKQLYSFLSSYELSRDIGAEFEYSNLGGGLLGHVLALRAGTDYETLVRTRICLPLGMRSTAIFLPADMKSRLAEGHNGQFESTKNWDLPTLAGAGALRSTATDMLSFLAAQLGYEDKGLAPAIAASRSAWMPAGPGMEIALGWLKRPKKDSEIIWHNGGTGGYRSFAGFDPKARTGVVVLTNVSTLVGVDDLGFHLLDPDSPLLPPDSPMLRPPKKRTEITLDPDVLEKYVGKYELAPNMIFTITRKDNQLYAQLTGQGASEIYPESETEFFLRVVDAQIIFKTDDKGRVNALVLHQLGRNQMALRIDGEADPVEEWFGHRIAEVDPSNFRNYIGRYQLAPGAVFTVTLEDNRLYVQLTGQPRLEVFPESEQDFFYKLVDAQITFETDGTEPATALILHQGGQNPRAPRIDE
jgi:D-alanyl-D-alanine-carboxypeptidase/D-alanyl-D-alanine-endopeptidase